MARAAEAEGALPAKLLIRLERLAERLADDANRAAAP